MLTPAFELSQDKDFLTIIIKAPYTKIADTEIFIDGTEFKFFSKPYFLRLNLPGNIIEDDRASAKYNVDDGSYTVKAPKETTGEFFDGLDMLTALLAPKTNVKHCAPKIEVLDTVEYENCTGKDDEEFDWQIEQTPFEEESVSTQGVKYGFANQKTGIFKSIGPEITSDIVDLADPEKTSVKERKQLCTQHEQEHFDEDHYLADLFENDAIVSILEYKVSWAKFNKTHDDVDIPVSLSEEEKEAMLKLPRKEYLLDEKETFIVYMGLVDLLLSYSYNHRTTEGESTVESAWTIRKLSCTLSWLEPHASLKDVVIGSFRRMLCYPLYRSYSLAAQILKDTCQILRLGRTQILKCLLEIHKLMNENDPCYILNDLYITDYCVWIQTASEKHIQSLGKLLAEIIVTKDDLGLDLIDLEEAAALVCEENEMEQTTKKMSSLNVGNETSSSKNNCKQSLKHFDEQKQSHSEGDSDSRSSDEDNDSGSISDSDCSQDVTSLKITTCSNNDGH